MLRSSAQAAGYPLHIEGIVDPIVDPGVPGGRQILSLVTHALGTEVSSTPINDLAGAVGAEAAVEIAGAAANFEIMNRVVDGVGLPFGRRRAEQMRADIAALQMSEWAHNPLV